VFGYKLTKTVLKCNGGNRLGKWGCVEIKSGLKEGDVIVTSGAYLINSEYISKKELTRWQDMIWVI